MNVLNRLCVTAACIAALVGCAASSPPPVLLALPAAVGAGSPAASVPTMVPAAPAPLLALRRITIPEYLIARRVRYRADTSTLAEWPNTFWAERIEVGVSREFTSALREQLAGWALCDATCGDQLPTLTLQVDLIPMDYLRSAKHLQAKARIVLSSTGTAPRDLKVQESTYDLPATADTPQAHAQAITDLLRQVAQTAATTIREQRPK
jgi:uncharacterized lipoprotein YmbA